MPERPHPNRKCTVEIVEDNEEKSKPKKEADEDCDCFNDTYNEIDELISYGESLKDEILVGIDNLSGYLNEKYIKPVKTILENCIDSLEQIFGTVSDFIHNYNDMKEANTIGADKYFHSKANCNGSKRGELGAQVAKGISDLRE